jgi:O-antigen/teichoic acid export membrane protein
MVAKLFLLLGASQPKRYLKSAGWVVGTRILSLSVSLASMFYIARTLGPFNFGELNYATSLVNMLAFFGAIASSVVISRDLVKYPSERGKILGTAYILTLLGVLVTVILAVILTFTLPHSDITFLVVGLLCLAQLCSPFQVIQNHFVVQSVTRYVSLTQLGVHVTVSMAKILAMTYGQGVLVLAAIMLIEQILLAAIMVTLYQVSTKTKITTWTFDKNYAKHLALDSIPFVFISMSIVVAGRIDQVFLKHFIDTTAVGIYSVAVQLTELWQVIPQMLLVALFPALVNAHLAGRHFRHRVMAFVVLLSLYGTLAVFITTVAAPYAIALIYGAAYVASIPLLQIYIWSIFGTIGGFLITHVLVAENQRIVQIAVGIIPMILNILLNLWWIPDYGAAGAAYATVVSYSLAPFIPLMFPSIRQSIKQYYN